jgi:uncharacterized membrane protein
MLQTFELLAIAAAVGCGLMSGLLFAFSLVVMRALAELPAQQGMHAMQRINVLIVHPLFLVLFLGTALCCAGLLLLAWRNASSSTLVALGAAAYLVVPWV